MSANVRPTILDEFQDGDRPGLFLLAAVAQESPVSFHLQCHFDAVMSVQSKLAEKYIEVQILLLILKIRLELCHQRKETKLSEPKWDRIQSCLKSLAAIVPNIVFAKLQFLTSQVVRGTPDGLKLEVSIMNVINVLHQRVLSASAMLTQRCESFELNFSEKFPFNEE